MDCLQVKISRFHFRNKELNVFIYKRRYSYFVIGIHQREQSEYILTMFSDISFIYMQSLSYNILLFIFSKKSAENINTCRHISFHLPQFRIFL